MVSEMLANSKPLSLFKDTYVIRRSLVSSFGRVPVCCAGGRGFEPQTGPTLRVLK